VFRPVTVRDVITMKDRDIELTVRSRIRFYTAFDLVRAFVLAVPTESCQVSAYNT